MQINNLDEANAALLPYVPMVKQLTGANVTLERIRPLMEFLGSPQERIKVIHLAGTSGKTSTAYFLSAILTAAGQKTGLTVSPHVDKVTERLQINGAAVPDEEFCRELGEFLELVEQSGIKASYFEVLYAFAIWYFDRAGVDYAVVETGMGGLHDATNVVVRPDKVCVITDIGFDHMHILGDTLAEIAAQKIGIVHEGNAVFTYRQEPEVMAVYENWVSEHKARLHVVADDYNGDFISLLPDYQKRNWTLAYKVYEYLCNRDKLQHLTSKVLQNTQEVLVPARMETWTVQGKTVVMDGAHNLQKMTAFTESFKHLYGDIKPPILIALKESKEYAEIIPLMKNFAGKVIVTTFDTTQDLPSRSLDPAILVSALKEQGVDAEAVTDQRDAFRRLMDIPAKVYVITGSFYLLSQLRNNKQLV